VTPRLTLFEASRMAADPDAFDRWLLEAAPAVLPDPDQRNGALRVLARP
jgi:hypothetical protein